MTKPRKNRSESRLFSVMRPVSRIVETLAHVGTVAVAILAVVIFFKKDLIHENVQLINEKVDLIDRAGELRAENASLNLKNSLAEQDLHAKRDEVVARQREVAAANRTLSLRQAELRGSESRMKELGLENQSLVDQNVRLRRENEAVSSATRRASERILPVLVALHLRAMRPTLQGASDLWVAEYLYDPRDEGFRAATQGHLGAFMFWTGTSAQLEANAGNEDQLCHLGDGYVARGAVIWYSKESISMFLLSVQRDSIFRQACEYLGTKINMVVDDKKVVGPLFRLLGSGPSDQYGLVLLPGAFGEQSFEEVETTGFWDPMIGILGQEEQRNFVDPKVGRAGELVHKLISSGELAVSFREFKEAVGKTTRKSLKEEGLADVVDSALQLEQEWKSYLVRGDQRLPVDVQKPVTSARASKVLPRLTLRDVEFRKLIESYLDVRRYKAETYCRAVRFAVESGHISRGALEVVTDYDECVQYGVIVGKGGREAAELSKSMRHLVRDSSNAN